MAQPPSGDSSKQCPCAATGTLSCTICHPPSSRLDSEPVSPAGSDSSICSVPISPRSPVEVITLDSEEENLPQNPQPESETTATDQGTERAVGDDAKKDASRSGELDDDIRVILVQSSGKATVSEKQGMRIVEIVPVKSSGSEDSRSDKQHRPPQTSSGSDSGKRSRSDEDSAQQGNAPKRSCRSESQSTSSIPVLCRQFNSVSGYYPAVWPGPHRSEPVGPSRPYNYSDVNTGYFDFELNMRRQNVWHYESYGRFRGSGQFQSASWPQGSAAYRWQPPRSILLPVTRPSCPPQASPSARPNPPQVQKSPQKSQSQQAQSSSAQCVLQTVKLPQAEFNHKLSGQQTSKSQQTQFSSTHVGLQTSKVPQTQSSNSHSGQNTQTSLQIQTGSKQALQTQQAQSNLTLSGQQTLKSQQTHSSTKHGKPQSWMLPLMKDQQAQSCCTHFGLQTSKSVPAQSNHSNALPQSAKSNCTQSGLLTSQSQQAQSNKMLVTQQVQPNAMHAEPPTHVLKSDAAQREANRKTTASSAPDNPVKALKITKGPLDKTSSAGQRSSSAMVQSSTHLKHKKKKKRKGERKRGTKVSRAEQESPAYSCHSNANFASGPAFLTSQCRGRVTLTDIVVIDLETECGDVIAGRYRSPHLENSPWFPNSVSSPSPLGSSPYCPSWSGPSQDAEAAFSVTDISSDDLPSGVSTVPSPEYDSTDSPLSADTELAYKATLVCSPATPLYSPASPSTTKSSSENPPGSPVPRAFPTSIEGLLGFPVSVLGCPSSPLGIPTSPLVIPPSPLVSPKSPLVSPKSPPVSPKSPLDSLTSYLVSPSYSLVSPTSLPPSSFSPSSESPATSIYSPSDSIGGNPDTSPLPSEIPYSPSMPTPSSSPSKNVTVSPNSLERMVSEAVQKALRKEGTCTKDGKETPDPLSSRMQHLRSQTDQMPSHLLPLQAFVAQWGLQLTPASRSD